MNESDITLYDNSRMFDVLANFGNQISEAYGIGSAIEVPAGFDKIRNVVICGLGGSAVGGDLLRSFLQYKAKVPVFVNRNYSLPAFADGDTLVIASSYSGNTEETLSAYGEAKHRKSKIICISSGGKLSLLAENDGNLLVKIPKGYQPRCAIAFSFFPLLMLMHELGLADDYSDIIIKISGHMKRRAEEYTLLNEGKNIPIRIARFLQGKIPVIYSSNDLLDIVNLRWRCELNENAKTLAFGNLLPEMNHNEIVGWQENPELLKNFAVVFLRDKSDHPQVQKRMDITREIVSPLAASLMEIDGEGTSKLERIIDLIHLGDWVSFYLAIIYNIDPTPVEKINYLKSKLSES